MDLELQYNYTVRRHSTGTSQTLKCLSSGHVGVHEDFLKPSCDRPSTTPPHETAKLESKRTFIRCRTICLFELGTTVLLLPGFSWSDAVLVHGCIWIYIHIRCTGIGTLEAAQHAVVKGAVTTRRAITRVGSVTRRLSGYAGIRSRKPQRQRQLGRRNKRPFELVPAGAVARAKRHRPHPRVASERDATAETSGTRK